jgi:M6 family metalloprotease-like protein
VVTSVEGVPPSDAWSYEGDLGSFVLAAGGQQRQFSNLAPGTYTITQRGKDGYVSSSTSTGGESGSTSITVTLEAGGSLTVTFTNTKADERIAVIAVKYADTVNTAYTIAQLKERADLVRQYYDDQSYSTCQILMDFIFGDSFGALTTDFEDYDRNGDGVLDGNDDPKYDHVFTLADDAMSLAAADTGFDAGNYSAVLVIQPGCIRSAAKGAAHRAVSGIRDSYATWAHELGHALPDLQWADYYLECPRETGGNVGIWCLMGEGNMYDPASPVMGYNKVQADWLEWNDDITLADPGPHTVGLLSELDLGDRILRVALDSPPSTTRTLVLEGRDPPDGVQADQFKPGRGSCAAVYWDNERTESEGVEVYVTESQFQKAAKVYAIPHDLDGKRTVTLKPGDSLVDLVDDVVISASGSGSGLAVTFTDNRTTDTVVVDMSGISVEELFGCVVSSEPTELDGQFDVDLHIYDADGRHVGMNYATGEYEVEIPGATTWGNVPGGGPEWIGVPAGVPFHAVSDATPAREWAELHPTVDPSDLHITATVTVIGYSSDGQRSITSRGNHQLDVFRTTPLCTVGMAHALGDVNGDGAVSLVDVRLCLQIATCGLKATAEQLAAADVDSNGDVDMADVEILAEYVTGLGSTLP